jgi:hypothetical protein
MTGVRMTSPRQHPIGVASTMDMDPLPHFVSTAQHPVSFDASNINVASTFVAGYFATMTV